VLSIGTNDAMALLIEDEKIYLQQSRCIGSGWDLGETLL
jgi:hypothetical protein